MSNNIDSNKNNGWHIKASNRSNFEEKGEVLSQDAFINLVLQLYEAEEFPSSTGWKGRIVNMLESSIPVIVEVFKLDGKECTKESVKRSLSLPYLIKFSKDERVPKDLREHLVAYLLTLPAFKNSQDEQAEITIEQHGFLQMNATCLLNQIDVPFVLE